VEYRRRQLGVRISPPSTTQSKPRARTQSGVLQQGLDLTCISPASMMPQLSNPATGSHVEHRFRSACILYCQWKARLAICSSTETWPMYSDNREKYLQNRRSRNPTRVQARRREDFHFHSRRSHGLCRPSSPSPTCRPCLLDRLSLPDRFIAFQCQRSRQSIGLPIPSPSSPTYPPNPILPRCTHVHDIATQPYLVATALSPRAPRIEHLPPRAR